MPVEWLSDNGSPYTAKETRVFATQLNLVPCVTPVASPESNGLAEAFVRTFKRDYARLVPLPDAGTVLGQLGGWFDDYNHNHPHPGLGMRSPREFIRAQQPAKVSGLTGATTPRDQLVAHDDRARPWLLQAARLGLRGNALIDYLEANAVRPPRWPALDASGGAAHPPPTAGWG